ncbi:RNA polymerase sigma factor [Massilia antarctica]|uniref:RNA polymerase sigma factor n=1 Tax=Massilia antarctica TaxID=2765360 RepID=A0AA48W948_9BURK|nr:RNA polymerase sigma factor [Massilia antarctica]QPI47661.1 RNA polymerase sigma factor [Massilia antarctica]
MTIEYTASPAAAAIDVQRLFLAHRQHLVRFVQRYTRSLEDAEDVVQNTFIEAMRCADRFSGLSKPSTWLFGIALNLARNQVRRNSADLYEPVEEGFMEQIADQFANPADRYASRQITRQIDSLLRSLPPKIRETFDVVVNGDATYEQAADYLAIPVGTVRSRVSRVRAAVRQQFGSAA